jgi:hypothetical protein
MTTDQQANHDTLVKYIGKLVSIKAGIANTNSMIVHAGALEYRGENNFSVTATFGAWMLVFPLSDVKQIEINEKDILIISI